MMFQRKFRASCLLLTVLAVSAAFAAAAEPMVTAAAKPNGITEIMVTPAGGDPIVYRLDLSKHYLPATKRTSIVRRWESMKFGAFVCFNSNQFDGNEHSVMTDPTGYNPRQLDVAGWIATFKSAGMRYAVLTTRHTSGFLLWDSPTTTLDVGSSGNKTDVVKEFVDECRRQGVAPGLYYCLWGGAAWKPTPNARALILAQLHELATCYGTVPYFWIDMANWRPADLSVQEIYDTLKSAQPDTVVMMNQHIEDGTKLSYFPTDAVNGELKLPPAKGHNPHRTINSKTYYLPFEYCLCSQQRKGGASWDPLGPSSWFTYCEARSFTPSHPFPVETLCRQIKLAYDRGATNVLLSTAPDYTGRMRQADVDQLVRLGLMLADKPIEANPQDRTVQ